MRLAAGAAGYGMASSLWPMLAVVAIAAAAAGSERRFHYAVVIRVVVVIEARRRSRRHRGCRRRLGNVSGGPQAPIDRALRLSGARTSQRQQPTDVRKERARATRLLAENAALTSPRSDGPFRWRFEWKS